MVKEPTNAAVLAGILTDFVHLPFAYSPVKEENRRRLIGLFSALEKELAGELAGAPIARAVTKLRQDLDNGLPDEAGFYSVLGVLLAEAGVDENERDLGRILGQVAARARMASAAAEKSRVKAAGLKADEIDAHDRKIIARDLQLYALDYFLMVFKRLQSAGGAEEKAAVISEPTDKLPAPAIDALEDDMLKKIVYRILDENTRERLIADYYEYKRAFLDERGRPANIGPETTARIEEALRKYCLTLLTANLAYGIKRINDGVYFPFGQDADIEELIRKIRA